MEQAAKLMRPKQAAKEEDIDGAIELWKEKSNRLARHAAHPVPPMTGSRNETAPISAGAIHAAWIGASAKSGNCSDQIYRRTSLCPLQFTARCEITWQAAGPSR